MNKRAEVANIKNEIYLDPILIKIFKHQNMYQISSRINLLSIVDHARYKFGYYHFLEGYKSIIKRDNSIQNIINNASSK